MRFELKAVDGANRVVVLDLEAADEASARDQCGRVIATFEPRFPAVARLLTDAEDDLLAHFAYPEVHRRQIRSTRL